MNANELADKLEQGHWEGGTREQAATMLRQQQAEYYSLLVNHDKLYAKVVEQQAEIEALKKEVALQRLSDFTQEADNEPVAWMELYFGEPNNIAWTNAELKDSGDVYKTIPLYTHPANKKVEKNTDLYEKVCNCTKKLDLTDEEIIEIWSGMETDTGEQNIDFARAILKKAQEK